MSKKTMLLFLRVILLCMLAISLLLFCNELRRTHDMQKGDEGTEPVEITEEVGELFEFTEAPTEEEIDYESNVEFQRWCMLTCGEAVGETLEGQIAVAAVIKNRIETSGFPDTFEEVINQRSQFSVVRDGEIYLGRNQLSYEEVSEQIIDAVKRAIGGEDPTEMLLAAEADRLGLDPVKYAEGGALYFYNPDACSEKELEARDKIKVKVSIGDHIFYKYWDQ